MEKKIFEIKIGDILTSRTDIDLIKKNNQQIWVMNHIFINPTNHDEHEISLLMEKVINFIKQSGISIWVLDPIAIEYFKKHPELNNIWAEQPFSI
ncbi:N-acetyltransferase [Lactobacillus sp. LL6]|uniref:N-acetyltransferase n=1 Tax=Lactobacillus sp. LL6 TaxID=2596827 RepID=UPI001186FDF6|nr:N-acetyltransferase [Lactobacillus sp. LL6]TSO25867.1 N-acetyltransferase [Lactobacillus sp. LL6]